MVERKTNARGESWLVDPIEGKPSTEWDHEEHMRAGASMGWWDRWDDVGPFKTIRITTTPDDFKGTMAHIMVRAEQFKSIQEAKNAGWGKPVTLGEHLLKKRRVVVIVT